MDGLILSPNVYSILLDGVETTLRILGQAFALGVVLSLVFGVARLSQRRAVRGAALAFVELARGISSIVLLFIMAYAIPILFGIPQRNLPTLAAIALGINMGGYGAEIIRGAILSVPRGQTEASIALNLSETQRLRHVVLPQALRIILPPFGNLTIEILKGTALVSLVGLTDLAYAADRVRNVQSLPGSSGISTPILFLNVLVMYFVLSQVINAAFRFAEHRVDRRFDAREPGLSALDRAKVGL